MKVTIIGGSGFLGNSLCDELLNSHIEFEILDLVHQIKNLLITINFSMLHLLLMSQLLMEILLSI